MVNGFRTGSGTYKCSECGHLTRDTGNGEGELGYCAFCLRGYELDNECSDGHITRERFNEALKELCKEYGRDEHPVLGC